MTTAMLIELFGYLGSVLVVVSMLMSSVVKLRVINTVGSIISGTYALIIGSFPLALMNICLVIINVYNLRKLLMTKNNYELIDTGRDNAFLEYFLQHYKDDIKTYFPDFTGKTSGMNVAYMICCDANPAGVFLGRDNGHGEIDISLEYTTPTYRDCSVGKYLYAELLRGGTQKLIFAKDAEKHKSYLKKMGYSDEKGIYMKRL